MHGTSFGIGARIRVARREKGWTQETLAEAVGVSRSAVAQWETDRAGQVTGNLARIAAALGTDVEWLMHGTDQRRPAEARNLDELAIIRLYRACLPEDREAVLRLAKRLVVRNKERPR
jgi:transcriptional regulator with XRE-family HTH domain